MNPGSVRTVGVARVLEQPPPDEIATQLRGLGLDADQLVLCTYTDIDRAGRYHDEWLAVTPERLVVVSDGDAPHPSLAIDLRQATEFRTQHGVGSGLLQARVGDTYVDLLRFSNRRAFRFEKIARKLDRYLQGEPLQILPEDELDPRRCPKCGLMRESETDSCPQCVDRGAVLLRMWRLMQPYRLAALGIMGLLLAGIGLDLVSPQLTRYLVDTVLPGSAEEAGQLQASPTLMGTHMRMLLGVVLVLAVVQTLRMGVNLVNGWLSSKVGTAITFDVRGRLVDHLQQLSVSYYDKQQVGSLVGRVAYDTEALHGFINQLTGGFLLQVLMLVGVGIMMFIIDSKLAAYTLIPGPFVVSGTLIFWRYIYPLYYKTWDASSKQAGLLSGLLSGIRVVKAFGQERRENGRFDATSGRIRDTRRGLDYAFSTFNPIMGIVFQLGGWIVWYVGGHDVIENRLTLGELMAFFGYLWMFYGPLGALPQFTSWLTTFVTQAHRVFEILDTPVQIPEPTQPVHVNDMQGRVDFEGVTFGYNRHAPVLHELSLNIAAGEMVGIVGHSGSGKTTLVNLLCRFYDVDEGRVLIDGVDVRDIPKLELRNQIGVVLQEPFLFRGSIWENLSYGDPHAAPEAVIAAAKAGNCHDFIMRQQHAYDTWVGERGAGLSGGERQRVGIARVLLTNPRILILDEATSSVDTESEAAIQAGLAAVVRGRTTIAIAHRLSTLQNARRIIVLDSGRIVETGSHAELMAVNGKYARMVRTQRGRDCEEADVDRVIAAAEQIANSIGEAAEREADSQAEAAELAPGDAPELRHGGDLSEDEMLPAGAAGPEGEPEDPLATHKPRWLSPDFAHIHLGTYETLHITIMNERIYGGVFALRCLPVRYPDQYISLRYRDGCGHEIEVGLIRDLADWPEGAQSLVRQSLSKHYFIHTVRAIHDIRLINNYLMFRVETDLGPQRFTIRWQADRALEYGPHGKMLLDTDENRYLIPDVRKLSAGERSLFQRFIYW